MELTQEGALRAYAKMMNTLSTEPIEALLADDFVYESQYVFAALESKQAFLDYMVPKLETVARAKAFVYAEMLRSMRTLRTNPASYLPRMRNQSWSVLFLPR